MAKVQFYEKGISANRNLIALIIISFTMVGIILISWFYFSNGGKNVEDAEKIFNTLIPLFATWIGTVLAFYFGRENFEAASNRYEQIINNLSPEVLDDILLNQIMISRKTMVINQLSEVKKKSIKELISFLESIDKSRLPILENEKIIYIIHKSTFLEAIAKNNEKDLKFDEFEEQYKAIITKFIKVFDETKLENVRNQISEKNIKDVFVIDANEKVLGWLTDTLIIRFLKSK